MQTKVCALCKERTNKDWFRLITADLISLTTIFSELTWKTNYGLSAHSPEACSWWVAGTRSYTDWTWTVLKALLKQASLTMNHPLVLYLDLTWHDMQPPLVILKADLQPLSTLMMCMDPRHCSWSTRKRWHWRDIYKSMRRISHNKWHYKNQEALTM